MDLEDHWIKPADLILARIEAVFKGIGRSVQKGGRNSAEMVQEYQAEYR
jgi:hypothetical protein